MHGYESSKLWVRIILVLGTNHLNFGYESSGYETSVGTKRPVSVTDYQSLYHFVRSCVAVDFFISSFSGTLTSSSILGSLDSKYLDKLNSYLDPVLQSPGSSRFVRCWRAKTDGWAASTFHSNCDGKGPTVTSSKSVITYLVDTSTSRGEVSI